MDFKITKEDVFNNAQTSLVTTRQKRYQNIKFSAEVEDGKYTLTSERGKLSIDVFDEIVLYIIAKFRFCPMWMVQQWYEDNMVGSYIGSEKIAENKIKSFIEFGLIYELPSAVAVFLMPTNRLAALFNIDLGPFISPPYNTLTHTISEEQVMFECMTGKAQYLKDKETFPFVSSLGLGRDSEKCIVIPESEYKLKSSYVKNNLKLLNDQESQLIQEMLEGKRVTTLDMKELQLVIHKKIDANNYDFKVPDLSILSPRELDSDGVALPKSIGLEVELTNKGRSTYEHLLNLYYDNNKFGYCIYLTPDVNIKRSLMKAIDSVFDKAEKEGVEQTCKFEIVEFEVPYDRSQLLYGDYE